MASRPIPTIAEIRAATTNNLLSRPDASATVVKVGQDLAVKFGRHVNLSAADNMRFVYKNSKVPVPKVFATMTKPETGCNFIVMEYIEGEPLEKAIPSLTISEKLQVGHKIQAALEYLRKLPPPDYFGSLDRQAYKDGIFWTRDNDPAISGPFDTEDALNEGMLKQVGKDKADSYVTLLRKLISETLHNHRNVFAHGDLQPKNIIVQRAQLGDGEKHTEMKIKIIDWEVSGWYPEYWEFCSCTVAGQFRSQWLEMVQQIMHVYAQEYLMLEAVRGLTFY